MNTKIVQAFLKFTWKCSFFLEYIPGNWNMHIL